MKWTPDTITALIVALGGLVTIIGATVGAVLKIVLDIRKDTNSHFTAQGKEIADLRAELKAAQLSAVNTEKTRSKLELEVARASPVAVVGEGGPGSPVLVESVTETPKKGT